MADSPPEDGPEPANLRFLRRLVTVLTATMIVGLIAIFVVLVIRLQDSPPPWPELTALPENLSILSVSRTVDHLVVVTADQEILILSPDGKVLLRTLQINQNP